jgi:hypothetical protein
MHGRNPNPYGRCRCWRVRSGNTASHAIPGTAGTLKGALMRGLKTLLCSTALLAPLALTPLVNAQVVVSIGVPPVCSYGYYDYSPYACAPVGFYGPGYFYNGIFLGMGPWAGWGYNHGWGGHRFSGSGGGRYNGGNGGASAVRASSNNGHARPPAGHARPAQGPSRAASAHGSAPHSAPHAAAPHAAAAHDGGGHGGGGASHGGGGSHGGHE